MRRARVITLLLLAFARGCVYADSVPPTGTSSNITLDWMVTGAQRRELVEISKANLNNGDYDSSGHANEASTDMQMPTKEHIVYDDIMTIVQARAGGMLNIKENDSSYIEDDIFVVPLANISWLDDGVSGNGSHLFVPIAGHLEGFVVAEPPILKFDLFCTARRRIRPYVGHCLPLARCALQEFVQNVYAFSSYFCPIGRHAGVCCPKVVTRTMQWALDAKTRSQQREAILHSGLSVSGAEAAFQDTLNITWHT